MDIPRVAAIRLVVSRAINYSEKSSSNWNVFDIHVISQLKCYSWHQSDTSQCDNRESFATMPLYEKITRQSGTADKSTSSCLKIIISYDNEHLKSALHFCVTVWLLRNIIVIYKLCSLNCSELLFKTYSHNINRYYFSCMPCTVGP